MAKLLTEQELRLLFSDFTHDILVDTPDGRERKKVVEIDEVFSVIQSQKLAHGEMVIGKNREYSDRDPKWYQKCCDYINVVKGKQRERNK